MMINPMFMDRIQQCLLPCAHYSVWGRLRGRLWDSVGERVIRARRRVVLVING